MAVLLELVLEPHNYNSGSLSQHTEEHTFDSGNMFEKTLQLSSIW